MNFCSMNIRTLLLTTCMTVLLVMPAAAQNKFENKDTAVDRQDHTWGTRKSDDSGGYFEQTERGDESWGTKTDAPQQPKDWNEDMVIVVEPDVGHGSKTTETITKDAAGNPTGSTTTTTTY